MSLSTNLQGLLKVHGISVTDVAKKTNIPQPVLYRLVTGHTPNPTVFTLSPIAKFFSLSISQLIDDEPLPQNLSPNTISTVKSIATKTKVPLIDWENSITWRTAEKKNFEKSILVDDDIYNNKLYALNINEYNYDISNRIFPENTTIIIDPDLTPFNKGFILVHKKTSVYPYIAQFLKKNNGTVIKDLNNELIIRKISKDEKIIGVIIQSQTNYIKKNNVKKQDK